MRSIAERVRWVCDDLLKQSQRQVALNAGLSHSHVSAILRGAKKDPPTDVNVGTLIAIARYAKVDFTWLATGEGAPFREPVIEYDERYPSRAEVLREFAAHVIPAAVRSVASMHLDHPSDPGRAYWIRELHIEMDRILEERRDPEGVAAKKAALEKRAEELSAPAEAAQAEARAELARRKAAKKKGTAV